MNLTELFPDAAHIPADMRIEPLELRHYLVGGELKEWEGEHQPIHSPILVREGTELNPKYLGSAPMLSGEAALEALDAAVKAYDYGRGEWPTMPVRERIRHVEDFILEMMVRRAEIVQYLMWEIAKNRKDAEKEFDRTVTYLHDTISVLKQLDRDGTRFEIEEGVVAQIRNLPLGVGLVMGPFNYPLNETFCTLIPMLLMGNTAILKPAKYGILLMKPLQEAFQKCFPKGVVNIIYGDGRVIVSPIVQSGKLNLLSFIGSSKVGNSIVSQHPKPNRFHTVLGLDAKNPAILLPDADLKTALPEILTGTLTFNGQRCTALKILFVHRSIADEFLAQYSQALAKLKVGLPWDDGVNITPLAEWNKVQYLNELIADAEAHGAKVVNEGGGASGGTLFNPAVLYPVNDQMRIWQEEQFGPVIPVTVYDEIEEFLDYVVTSNFGQQVSIFGKDTTQVAQLVDTLVYQVARVNLNSQCQRSPDSFPFSGRKDSAEDTLSVKDALLTFSIQGIVAARETDPNKELLTHILRERKSVFLSNEFLF
jgi:glyceraldehyde-3-phosphate dehydrogenase (NADP+)